MMNILSIGLVVLIAYVWMGRGFLSSFLNLVCVLIAGGIAFAVWEPWPTRAMRAIPGTRILVSNDQIQIVRNFVYMNKGWAEANQEATQRLMRSLIQAQEFIAANPAEAAAQVARFLRLQIQV